MAGWSIEAIKEGLAERGYTLVGLARARSLHARACIHALHHRHTPGEQAIADALGVPLHEIWPDRWTATGQRIDRRFLPKRTPLSTSVTRQKRKAA